jgi:hypothetical protein
VRPIGCPVNAWAAENQLVFAQVQTEAKSNEITAIPVLLEQIAIAGCIITTPVSLLSRIPHSALALSGGRVTAFTFSEPVQGAFFRAKPEKTGLFAPIPQKAFGFSAGFPLQSLARKKSSA